MILLLLCLAGATLGFAQGALALAVVLLLRLIGLQPTRRPLLAVGAVIAATSYSAYLLVYGAADMGYTWVPALVIVLALHLAVYWLICTATTADLDSARRGRDQ